MIYAAERHRRETNPDRKPSRAVDIFKSWWLQSFGYAFAALYLRCTSSFFIEREAGSLAAPGCRSTRISQSGGRPGCKRCTGPRRIVRSRRIRQDPGGAVRARRGLLPELAVVSADILSGAGAAGVAAVRLCVHHLGCGDIAGLRRRRLSDRAAPGGDRAGAGRAVYRVEFYRRAKRIPDGIAAGCFAAFPRSPTGDGRRRLSVA